MAFETRGNRTYYYRSVRRDRTVRKEYFGGGDVSRFAAAVDAARRADRTAADLARRRHRARVDEAMRLTEEVYRGCGALAAAALLAAGYHRPGRHHWRTWRHGRRVLRSTD